MRKYIKNRLSIIIPTYNEANNITSLTTEIIDLMKDRDYEILIVDDGSTDNTNARMKEFVDYPNVVIHSLEKNSGLSVARNTGIRLAKGSIFCFLDSDMTVEQTWLQTFQLRFEDENVVGIIGDCRLPKDVKPNKLDHYFLLIHQ